MAANWFSKLSKEQQAAYLKAHPGSKMGKGKVSKSLKSTKSSRNPTEAEKMRYLKRENKYYNARQAPYDSNR